MIKEILRLMDCFPGSSMSSSGYAALHPTITSFGITVSNVESEIELKAKMLESLSRFMYKYEPYSNSRRNMEWRMAMLMCANNYLGSHFSVYDIAQVYIKLGYRVNHDLTLQFIESGYDMSILSDSKNEVARHE